MPQRTAQLIGFSDGCEISITWNNTEVFRDSVPAAGARDQLVVLAEWTTDTDILGDIPLVIECLSGSLHFANIHMNMYAPISELQLTSQPDWTTYTPTVEELRVDLSQLTAEQIATKYGLTRSDIWQHTTVVELLSIESNFCQPFNAVDFTASDGKTSVTIDGAPYTRHSIDRYPGAWQWQIQAGKTFSCLFQVDAPPA